MKQALTITLMLAVLVTGIEGAIDLAATSLGSGVHEMHQQHPQVVHEDHDHDHDDESHMHVCHCGAHAPPLPFSLAFVSSPDHDPTPAFHAFLNSAAGTPPLLQPPIAGFRNSLSPAGA